MYLLLLLYVAPFVLLTVLTEAQWFGFATIELVVFAGIMGWIHHQDFLPFVQAHALDLVKYSALYVALGIGWAYIKWARTLYNFRSDFREAKAKFCVSQRPMLDPAQPIPFAMMLTFTNQYGYQFRERPQAVQNKSRIIAWMSLWPCSVIGFVLNDPIRKLFTGLFNLLRSSYQHMSDRIVNDVEFSSDRAEAELARLRAGSPEGHDPTSAR